MGGRSMAGRSRQGGLWVGGGLCLVLLLAGLLSLVWTPYPIGVINVANRLAGPSAAHWLGTDAFGRDVLSLLLAGAANSILVAVVAVGVGIGIGVPLGALASATGGWLDDLVMRLSDFAFAFPALLTAVMITALWGPGRGQCDHRHRHLQHPGLRPADQGCRDGALAAGFRRRREAGRDAARSRSRPSHILPNVASLIIVQATIQFALAILAEAGLSYLGLGAQPPNPSWGRMLNEAQTMMFIAPQLAIYPGLCIVLSVLGLNLLGDGLRDLLDPRLRRARA